MRSIGLGKTSENTGLDEIQTAIAIHRLLDGVYSSTRCSDKKRFLQNKITYAQRNGTFEKFKQEYGTRNITHLLEMFSLTIHFWYSPNNGNFSETNGGDLVRPFIVRTIHSLTKRSTLHLLVNCINFDMNHERSFTRNISLIVDHEYLFDIQNQTKSFWENITIYADSANLTHNWPSTFSIFDERKFAKIFNFGFEIWFIESKFCQISNEVVMAKKQIYKSTQEKFVVLQYIGLNWPEEKETVFPSDLFILRNQSDFKILHCPNSFCFYNTHSEQSYERHKTSCSNITKVEYKQICLTWETPKQYLIRNKLIPEYESFNLVTFDIETLGDPEGRHITEETFLIETHKLVSIGIGCNFGRKENKVFLRDDFSEASLMKLIGEFWNELVRLQIEHRKTFPPEFQLALNHLNTAIANQSSFSDSILRSCRTYIHNLFTLKVASFNGERFDLPIIFPALLKFWNIKKSIAKDDPLNIVRRGLGIMSLDFRKIRIIDIRNYFPYGSLDQMGKIFKSLDMKLCFPYQAYSSVLELKEATDWPPYSAFHSSLKPHNDLSKLPQKLYAAFLKAEQFFGISSNDFFEQLNVYSAFQNYSPSSTFPLDLRFTADASSIFNLDPLLYVESWIKFEELRILGEVENMADFLKFYNLIDVRVTTDSFTRMIQLFHDKFHENLLEHPSLPGVAYQVLWNHFSTQVNKPFTFSQAFGWIAADIRQAIQGGLTTPFHCHLEIGDTTQNYPRSVTHAKSGKPYVEFHALDAANLYGFSMSQELPTGQGLLFKKTGSDQFEMKIMIGRIEDPKSRPFSKEAIGWLSWCQSLPEFQSVKIEHALNGGEKLVDLEDESFHPDGYCRINDQTHFFLYNGCFYHRHDCDISRESERVQADPKKQDRFEKIEALCAKYGKLHLIFGCQWLEMRENITIEKPFSVFFDQRRIKETELMDAILNDKLFGLIKCDVRSPDHVIDRYMTVNYPPITYRVTPEEDMIGDHILQRLKTSKKKIVENQLTQVWVIYHLSYDLTILDF